MKRMCSWVLACTLLVAGHGVGVEANSALVPAPQRGAESRHAEKVAAVAKEKFDLLMIGDSITHTVGEFEGKYAALKAVWARHYAPRRALNLGYSGARIENILWNLQNGELEGQNPKVAVLLIGTNNSDDRHFPTVNSPEQILEGTKAIVDCIRQRCPATKILVLRIFSRGGDSEKGVGDNIFHGSARCLDIARRAGELTAGLADGKQVFWLDVNHVFLRLDGTIDTDRMPDLLHPNAAGAEAWAQAIEPVLAELMGDQPRVDAPANTAVIPVPKLENDSYDWYARHAQVLSIRNSVNPEIVLIGDSITHFWGGEPKSNHANGPRAWQAAFGKYRTLNLGFGWDRTQNVLWRLDHGEFDGLHPRVVVLHIGTNNTSGTRNARQNTAAEIAEGIREIILRVRSKAPEARIVLMAVFPREKDATAPRRAQIKEINGLLAGLGGTPGITFLDIGPKLLQADGSIARDVMADFCHPTEKGYQVWADALVPLLAP
jgi:lysophospholipase L1-like esterase